MNSPIDALRGRAQPRGFTMVELMVTIGIIVILIGIVTVGVNSIVNSAHQRQTRTLLEAAQSILNEYNVQMGSKAGSSIPPWKWNGSLLAASDISSNSLKFFTVPYRNPLSPTGTPLPLPVPIPDYTKDKGQYNNSTWQMDNTGTLMEMLQKLSATNQMLTQLPKNSTTSLSGPSMTATALKDAWGGPLLFVPATGLGDGTPAGSVYAGATVDSSNPSGQLVGGTQLPTIKSPDGKPFWVSAGPDGDFRTGDDNLYSFGEQ